LRLFSAESKLGLARICHGHGADDGAALVPDVHFSTDDSFGCHFDVASVHSSPAKLGDLRRGISEIFLQHAMGCHGFHFFCHGTHPDELLKKGLFFAEALIFLPK